MATTDLLLICLCAICIAAFLARRVNVPSPIAFVAVGIALGALPGFPEFSVPPETLLLIFLPPLLMEAAYFTSIRDFKANGRPILQLAVGLVIVTCFATAITLEWLMPETTLALGFVLGAIISPPDAVAVTSITRQVKVPQRVVTILQGESLINDATGLILYKFAVAAVVTGGFSMMQASTQFLWMAVAGTLIGWAIGWCYMQVYPRIREMSVEILSTFLVPYAAYMLAEAVHGSGVLAVVAAGLTVGWYAPKRFTPMFRIPAEAVWSLVTFVLNGMVFLLIGLHFPGLLRQLTVYPLIDLLGMAAAVSVMAIAVRFAWVFIVGYGTWYLFPSVRRTDRFPPWQNVFIIAWTGMRGVVSLATALALPLTVEGGAPFPHRDLIIFLAFSVILTTLVLQGLTLPWLVRTLALNYEGNLLQESWKAKKEAAESAMKRLRDLSEDCTIQSAALERIVSHYEDRLLMLGDGPNTPLNPKAPPENHPLVVTESRIWKEVLEAERDAVVGLRQGFAIGDDVMHEILRDIDLLHNRFANHA
jgi:monovalent cation/hydrogen antiporter